MDTLRDDRSEIRPASPPAVEFDRLGSAASSNAWAEPTIVRAFAENWDRELFGLEIPEWRASVVDLLERLHHANPRERLVIGDMGCSAGAYARHMLARQIAFDYHGYEHNEHVLKETCRRWEFLPHDHVHFHLLDLCLAEWPIPDGFFDALIWDSTLRVCDDPAAAIAQSARVCRGWIVLARTPLEQECRRSEVRTYGMKAPSVYWHFDEATIARFAEQNRLRAMFRVGAEDLHVLSRGDLPKASQVKPVQRWSRVFHEAFVRERVARLLREHDGPWVIFGAGVHSRWLWTLLPEADKLRFLCFVDDSAQPGNMIGDLPVRRPDEMAATLSFNVLVSSDSIEHTLWHRARTVLPNAPEVFRIYEAVPPGPYDKAKL